MAEINEELRDYEQPVAPRKPLKSDHRQRYRKNVSKNQTIVVHMPAEAPETNPNADLVPIRLHVIDRRSVWIHIDDVEWAVKYLFAQHELKGVHHVDPMDQGPSSIGSDAVWEPPALADGVTDI